MRICTFLGVNPSGDPRTADDIAARLSSMSQVLAAYSDDEFDRLINLITHLKSLRGKI